MVFAVELPTGYGFYVLGDRILIGYVFEDTVVCSHMTLGMFIHVYVCLYRYICGYSPAPKNELWNSVLAARCYCKL